MNTPCNRWCVELIADPAAFQRWYAEHEDALSVQWLTQDEATDPIFNHPAGYAFVRMEYLRTRKFTQVRSNSESR